MNMSANSKHLQALVNSFKNMRHFDQKEGSMVERLCTMLNALQRTNISEMNSLMWRKRHTKTSCFFLCNSEFLQSIEEIYCEDQPSMKLIAKSYDKAAIYTAKQV